ncbi:hypothetical protein MJN85_29105, partial [Salmonella enterica subsp. enterica serovar Anatum]|nr:hypothetical protein [Salmonella enterica subsp. enterica serovar Anatum]
MSYPIDHISYRRKYNLNQRVVHESWQKQYDFFQQQRDLGKRILDVTPQDSEALCLSEAWLAKAGIYVSAEYFRKGYDATR